MDYDPSGYESPDVVMPESTVGHCKNYMRCRQFNVKLGNGYCVACWDKGLDIRPALRAALRS